jgi:8-oxo-dGTP diphosphatase
LDEVIKYHYADGKDYPAIFVCADAVVFYEDGSNTYVAMIQRGDNGKKALPGGFLNYDEASFKAARRELKEETGMALTLLNSEYLGYMHFDDPHRTKVGNRKITTAHVFEVNEKAELKGADDAVKAFWVELSEVYDLKDSEVHDDHKNIIVNCIKLFNESKEK